MATAMARAMLTLGIVCLAACAPAATSQTPLAVEDVEPVQTDAAGLRVSFIVNFRPSHDLGQAQAMERAGRYDEAAQLVAATLRDDTALRGLCFERFTLGGAEIVLNVCAPSPLEDLLVTQRRWLEHLGATPGVAYVERNLVAQQEGATAAAPS